MNKLDIIKEIMGEDTSGFIAMELKSTYEDLLNEKENPGVPIWDYDDEIEHKNIDEMLNAIKIVYSWYSTKDINEIKSIKSIK